MLALIDSRIFVIDIAPRILLYVFTGLSVCIIIGTYANLTSSRDCIIGSPVSDPMPKCSRDVEMWVIFQLAL